MGSGKYRKCWGRSKERGRVREEGGRQEGERDWKNDRPNPVYTYRKPHRPSHTRTHRNTHVHRYTCAGAHTLRLQLLAFYSASKTDNQNPTHMSLPATWWLLSTDIDMQSAVKIAIHCCRRKSGHC
jgi:hypothetical protein